MVLPTGSLVSTLGPPAWTDDRFWDAPANLQRRADAWFWSCGCAAEPLSPGRFSVTACSAHHEALYGKLLRKQRLAAAGPSSVSELHRS